MKNDDIRIDTEIEKDLKDKMNSLSAKVNCFDKISARAFPESDTDFELVVSEVENVSGKFRTAPLIKVLAAAAAVVVCLAVIPRTSAFQNFLVNVNEKNNTDFLSIISEIEKETEANTYKTYDISLSDYAKYNIMVNPLCECPFRLDEENTDARVRLFVRTFDDIPTNQMYAVEYSGKYSRTNFIAAAETNVKFTDEDIASVGLDDEGNTAFSVQQALMQAMADMSVENSFYTDRYGEMTGENGTQLTAATYSYSSFFKEEDKIVRYPCQVIYFKNDDDTTYYYDILGWNDNETIWERSLYTDDTSALPTDEENDISVFRRVNLERGTDEISDSDENNKFGYYEPYISSESPAADDNFNTLKFIETCFMA